MLERVLLFAISLGATAALSIAGCSNGSSSGTGGTPCVTGTVHAEPTPPGAQVTPDGTGQVTFAVSRYFFGDTDRQGMGDKYTAWKDFGFDLDGKISTECSTDLCSPLDQAKPQNVAPDGNFGIDNNFGKSILPILLGISSTFAIGANNALAKGGATVLLDLDALGSGADYAPLTSRLYAGAPLGKPPAYDGSDAWPVRPELLGDPADVGSAKLTSTTSYLTGNTWVGRFQGTLPVEIEFGGHPLHLRVSNPVVSMVLDAQRQSATNGTLAGVLTIDDVIPEASRVLIAFDASLCPGMSTADSVLTEITQAADILADGTQDPDKPCGAISIGLGFEAKRVQLGAVAAPEVLLPSTCSDAGTGDGGDGGG